MDGLIAGRKVKMGITRWKAGRLAKFKKVQSGA